jgi:proteasome accessory factor B
VSRKIERLVNLTIALLATKRFLTKSEIFRTVEGYEGTPETKERMFERDKDDLRTLGIEILVGSFDPIFQDEAGYRINSDTYQLDIGLLSPLDLSLLSLAAQCWQGAALDQAAHRVLRKLRSIGIPADELDIPAIHSKLSTSGQDIEIISSAISESALLSFNYISKDLESQRRTVVPFALATHLGFWYVASVDQINQEIRIFRLDRVSGRVEKSTPQKDFEAPLEFDFQNALKNSQSNNFAILDVQKGKGRLLRNLAMSIKDLGEWDRLEVPIVSMDNLLSLALWHGEDVLVQEPKELVDMIESALQEILVDHE